MGRRALWLVLTTTLALFMVPVRSKANKAERAQELIKTGNEALTAGNYERAIAAFRDALKIQKKPAQAQAFLSVAYYRYGVDLTDKGDVDRALEAFRQALALGPDEAYWHAGLGAALEKKGDRRAALEEFQTASRLSPDDWGLAEKCKKLQAQPKERGTNDPTPVEKNMMTAGPKVMPKNLTAPKAIINPSPPYVEEARQAKYEGMSVLSFVVDAVGRPTEITVVKPLGMGLDQSAIKTVGTWQFQPATRDGIPVPVRVLVQVTFRLY